MWGLGTLSTGILLESIFEPFVESSRTESKACGVGLGLSICKEIIEAHSGNIWVENNSLKPGVTFNFTIPTNLFLSSTDPNNNKISDNVSNVFKRDLATMPITLEKRPFALIGISPFNSYFSAEKILEIFRFVGSMKKLFRYQLEMTLIFSNCSERYFSRC